jgi:hypothetical protein
MFFSQYLQDINLKKSIIEKHICPKSRNYIAVPNQDDLDNHANQLNLTMMVLAFKRERKLINIE